MRADRRTPIARRALDHRRRGWHGSGMSARVLLLGFDPASVPGVDANMVNQAIAIGQARFDAEGIAVENCLVRPDASARQQIIDALQNHSYEVIVIGGGIRPTAPMPRSAGSVDRPGYSTIASSWSAST